VLPLVRAFVDIMFHRRGPEDLPSSQFLVWLLLAVAVSVDLGILVANDGGARAAGVAVLIQFLDVWFVWALLRTFNRQPRFRIAGAGGAAHLPGMTAAKTRLPVLGVPVQSKALNGLDSLLSIVQMPKGIPVGTLAIGDAGAANAGILAASIVALHDPVVAAKLDAFRAAQTQRVLGETLA
jgi:phosphoribosylaminoimidazole carboxylase PurE protein